MLPICDIGSCPAVYKYPIRYSRRRMMKMNSSERQIYDFIINYRAINGYPPSISEIGDHLGMSKTNVWRYLKIMRARRVIDWKYYVPRTIEVIAPFK